MEYTTVRLSQIHHVVDLPEPVFRTRKDWRRYQVNLKRMRARFDAQLMEMLFGPPAPPPPPYRAQPRAGKPFSIFDCLNSPA